MQSYSKKLYRLEFFLRATMSILSRSTATFYRWFHAFHFKTPRKTHKDVFFFHILSIIILFGYSIIDTIMYSWNPINKPDSLIFIHGSRHIAMEILVIIYISGTAVFGISVEVYLFIPISIINCALAIQNCHGTSETIMTILWILKNIYLFVTVELCYRNVRELRQYETNVASSAHAMLRQALLFSITMIFLSSSGLRTLYHAVNQNSLLHCSYDTKHCGIINLYEPLFSDENDRCVDELINYIAGREQLPSLRNFIIINAISYSVFNVNFLEISHGAKYFWLRIIIIILLAAVTSSVVVSSIDPFTFINHCQLPYNIIECILLIILLALPCYNFYNLRHNTPSEEIPIMEKYPKILPTL